MAKASATWTVAVSYLERGISFAPDVCLGRPGCLSTEVYGPGVPSGRIQDGHGTPPKRWGQRNNQPVLNLYNRELLPRDPSYGPEACCVSMASLGKCCSLVVPGEWLDALVSHVM